MSKIDEFIQLKGFQFKPKLDTVADWHRELVATQQELCAKAPDTALETVIEYMQDLRLKANKINPQRVTISKSNGMYELYWVHKTKQRLDQTEIAFDLNRLAVTLEWFDAKLQLLKNTQTNPGHFADEANEFILAWTDVAQTSSKK
ncbi:MAG: hypothetical protein ACI9SY_000258 [Candidatus Paceibacteria bacterium]|jgi:hypothetical protein